MLFTLAENQEACQALSSVGGCVVKDEEGGGRAVGGEGECRGAAPGRSLSVEPSLAAEDCFVPSESATVRLRRRPRFSAPPASPPRSA